MGTLVKEKATAKVKANFIVGFLSGAVVSAGILIVVFGFSQTNKSIKLSSEKMQSAGKAMEIS